MRHFLGAALLAVGMAVGVGAAAEAAMPPVPPTGEQHYNILRDRERIGTQINRYMLDGDRLTVHTRMDIEVSVLFITAYKFELESREEWVDGQLVALTTRAVDGGKRKSVDLRADADAGLLQISYNGKERSAPPAGTLPASLWNPATVEQSALVDILNGKTRDVRIRPVGKEVITIGGQPVEAQHYSMTGELERELWYGTDGQLLQVVFEGPDGSKITIVKSTP